MEQPPVEQQQDQKEPERPEGDDQQDRSEDQGREQSQQPERPDPEHPELAKSAADVDQSLAGLVHRLTAALEMIPALKQQAIGQGDFEKARQLERDELHIQETMGHIRGAPISDALGGSALRGRQLSTVRGEDGTYAAHGSQEHMLGTASRLGKSQRGQ